MLKRGLLFNFIFVSFIAGVFVFSGCNEGTEKQEPSAFDQGPKVQQTGSQDMQNQAVHLYVDAMMLSEIQDWDQAIQKLNDAIEYAPEFSLAWSFKGDIYQLNEQYEKSADSYEQATKVDPWSFKDFSNLGKVCQILEDFARAVKAYVSACEINTGDFNVHLGAGRCYYELKDYELAFGYGQRAKEIDPEKGDVDVLLGDIYVEKDDLTEAIIAYRRALEIDGNKPKTMVSLAVAYTKLERYDSAEELLVDAIKLDEQSSTAFQYLGFVQLQLHKDDLSVALASYNKAVEIDEKDWMARKGLGVVYMLMFMANQDEANKAKAVEQWNISLTIKSDQPELKDLLQKCTASE